MLTLTARSLRRDAEHVAHEAGIPAAAAAGAAMASCAIARQVQGARAAFVDTAMVAGGAFMAAKGRGKIAPYAGVGMILGTISGILSKK